MMVVRNAGGGGIEVRVLRSRGAGEFWAARGRVLEVDMSSKVLARCVSIAEEAARHLRHGISPRRCVAHWVAASRELFVRTGKLFGTRRGSSISGSPEIQCRLAAQRSRVEKFPADFATVLESEDVFCDLSPLIPFTKWMDCEDASASAHTQVFLAGVASDLRDEMLTPAGFTRDWLAPELLLVEGRRGRFTLDFMTYACLRTLTDFESVDALSAEYR